jgi:hypothetical protein
MAVARRLAAELGPGIPVQVVVAGDDIVLVDPAVNPP